MTDDQWDDFILDQTFDHDAPSHALLQDVLANAPDAMKPRVWDFFREWIFQDWCDANFPPEPEPTPAERERQAAETDRWITEALARFAAADELRRAARRKMI